MSIRIVASLASAMILGAAAHASGFEDRIVAQERIDRYYYDHQLGAKKPFESVVSRLHVESEVRRYLKETDALSRFWDVRIDAETLDRELQRMATRSRAPGRLRELFALLDDDPRRIAESLVRPALVGRLVTSFFESDPRLHAASRNEADRIRRDLVSGSLDAWAPHSRRSIRSDRESARTVSSVREERGAFVVTVGLNDAEVAVYRIPKKSHPTWWSEVEGDLLDDRLPAPDLAYDRVDVSRALAALKGRAEAGLPCVGEDTWKLFGSPLPLRFPSGVWTGSEVIVWHGVGYRYDPAIDAWSEIAPYPIFPGGVGLQSTVWTGSEMIVWSGFDATNEGARYDPRTDSWTLMTTVNAPLPRYGHATVWTGEEMIVWGGYESGFGGTLSHGGRYDPDMDTWSTVSFDGPPASAFPAAVWTGSNKMFVWGGNGVVAGLYDPSSDTWSSISDRGAPIPHARPLAVWTGEAVLVWGESEEGTSGAAYDPATNTWSAMSDVGAPSPRVSASSVWTGEHMIVWGGSSEEEPLGDGARYDPDTDVWSPLPGGPLPRYANAGIWTGEELVIWGGFDGYETVGGGGRYRPSTDSWIGISTAPGAASSAVVWTGNEMIGWGGGPTGSSHAATGGRYDPALDRWTPTSPVGVPGARGGHTAVWTGDEMIVWGGDGPGIGVDPLDTGGRYVPLTDSWAPVSTLGGPSPRLGHSAVWTGDEMIVWGGEGAALYRDGARYDPTADYWTAVSGVQPPAARRDAPTVWTGSSMLVWGGENAAGNALASGGRYVPATDTWFPIATLDAPSGRLGASAVWTGEQMIVWGGYLEGTYLDDGARYDPSADSWSTISDLLAPEGRRDHSAVWTGGSMVVWGGSGSGLTSSSGGVYDSGDDSWTPTADAPLGNIRHGAVWTGGAMLIWGGGTNQGASYGIGGAVDDDGDGASECEGDCNDLDAGALSLPSEVTTLRFVDEETLEWDTQSVSAGPSTIYDVWRTSFEEGASCSSEATTLPSATDLDVPDEGEGFRYLVRGRNSCGPGTWGSNSDGEARIGIDCS